MADNLFGGKNSGRTLAGKQKVKTAKRRSAQSTRWLERQLNDPYVKRAQGEGYRSRAAYKLVELDEKFHILRGKKAVVDLGVAPGGWAQVVRRQQQKAAIVGIDLLPVDPLEGVVSGVVHRGGRCHGRRIKSLYLIGFKAMALKPHRQRNHVVVCGAGVRRNKIGNQILLLAGLF